MQNNKAAQAALAGNNLIIVLTIVSLLVIAGTALVSKMLVTSIVRDTKVVSAKNKANNQLDTNVKNAPNLVQAYTQLGNQQTILRDALPTTADFPSIMVTLENIAIQSKITMTSIEPLAIRTVAATSTGTAATGTVSNGDTASAAVAATPQPYRVTAKFTGTFDDFVKAVKAVELSARPMKFVNVKLSGTGRELAVQADIETYFQDKAQLPFGEETIK